MLGTICDTDIGRRRILEVVVNYKDHGFDVLGNLTRILYCKDNESIMNASGAIGTLVNIVLSLKAKKYDNHWLKKNYPI